MQPFPCQFAGAAPGWGSGSAARRSSRHFQRATNATSIALARVSRRLRDRGFVAKLRGAGSADALYALFAGGESRDAA